MSVLEVLGPACVALALHGLLVRCDRRTRWVRASIIGSAFVVTYWYFYWRATALPAFSLAYPPAIALLALELGSTLAWQFHWVRSALGYVDRSALATRRAGWYDGAPPLVDVFIPTYNENLRVLERTLVGALGMDYPNFRVWVLDDGRRDWVESFCQRLGVGYIRRGDNVGYKAGNLNHASSVLRQRSEMAGYVAVFDADFVPRATFLSRTMALMADPEIALVQTPQQFRNPDPIQYAFGAQHQWPDDLRFLFSVLMVGWDAAGNTSCCGTSFLVRTEALRAIGGFPTESVTEDLLMALEFHRANLRCVYLNETLSVGLAAEGLVDHLNQRARWVLGAAQVALGPSGPLGRHRWPSSWLQFCDLGVRPGLMALARQTSLWVPALCLLSGTPLVEATLPEAVRSLLPVVVARCSLSWLTRGAVLPVFSDVNHVVSDLTVLRSNLTGLFRPGHGVFKVTDKGSRRDTLQVHGKLLTYFAGLALLTLVGWASMLLGARSMETSPLGFHWLWASYNIVVLGLACVPCVERPKYRASERYPCVGEPAMLASAGGRHPARLLDIGVDGVALEGAPAQVGERVSVSMDGTGDVLGQVVRRRTDGALAIAFDVDTPARPALIRKLYGTDRYIQPSTHWELWSAARQVFARVAGLGRRAYGRRPESPGGRSGIDALPLRPAGPRGEAVIPAAEARWAAETQPAQTLVDGHGKE